MAAKKCPLMVIAKHTDPATLLFPFLCLERECAWYIKVKEDYSCAIPQLASALTAIGRLYADSGTS